MFYNLSMKNEKLIIFSAPSGAGKTTIVHRLLKIVSGLEFSVSSCSRPIRPKEIDGKDYNFISIQEFKSKIEKNEFLEWEEVYKNSFYGTLKSEVERIWENGKNVIFDVDVKGGLNIKKFYQDKALSIFIMPPSIEVLKQRLQKRSTENEKNLELRIEKAQYEISFADKFDKIIVNDDIDKAIIIVTETVENFLKE